MPTTTDPNLAEIKALAARCAAVGDESITDEFTERFGVAPDAYLELDESQQRALLVQISEQGKVGSASTEAEKLRSALEVLIPHVLHYVSMPHAHSDSGRDAANARKALAEFGQGNVGSATTRPSTEAEKLRSALEVLIPHVLHYASMPHAHSDSGRDAANARKALAEFGQGNVRTLQKHGYFAGARDPKVKPEFSGRFMVRDLEDDDGFCIVGDDLDALLLEALEHLEIPAAKKVEKHSDQVVQAELLGRNQAAIAEMAFEAYNFGEGVTVEGASGWEYCPAGHERSREVYVENAIDDGKENSTTRLGFTVRFDSQTGALAEAYALDHKGQIWGSLPQGTEWSLTSKVPERYESLSLSALDRLVNEGVLVEIPEGGLLDNGWLMADGYTKDLFMGATYMSQIGGDETPYATYDFTIAETEDGRWTPIHGSTKMTPVDTPEQAAFGLMKFWHERPENMKVRYNYVAPSDDKESPSLGM